MASLSFKKTLGVFLFLSVSLIPLSYGAALAEEERLPRVSSVASLKVESTVKVDSPEEDKSAGDVVRNVGNNIATGVVNALEDLLEKMGDAVLEGLEDLAELTVKKVAVWVTELVNGEPVRTQRTVALGCTPPHAETLKALFDTKKVRQHLAPIAYPKFSEAFYLGAPGPFMSKCLNQLTKGACTGFALAEAIAFAERTKTEEEKKLVSPLYIYYKERLREGTIAVDSGASLASGILVLMKEGACDEELWPYKDDEHTFKRKPTKECDRQAKENTLLIDSLDVAALNPQDKNSIKYALSKGHAVVGGILLFEEFMGIDATGNVPMPSFSIANKPIGGHAVCFFGWDDNHDNGEGTPRGAWLVQNHWGEQWGYSGPEGKGIFFLPYNYLNIPGTGWDFWEVAEIGVPTTKVPDFLSNAPQPKFSPTDLIRRTSENLQRLFSLKKEASAPTAESADTSTTTATLKAVEASGGDAPMALPTNVVPVAPTAPVGNDSTDDTPSVPLPQDSSGVEDSVDSNAIPAGAIDAVVDPSAGAEVAVSTAGKEEAPASPATVALPGVAPTEESTASAVPTSVLVPVTNAPSTSATIEASEVSVDGRAATSTADALVANPTQAAAPTDAKAEDDSTSPIKEDLRADVPGEEPTSLPVNVEAFPSEAPAGNDSAGDTQPLPQDSSGVEDSVDSNAIPTGEEAIDAVVDSSASAAVDLSTAGREADVPLSVEASEGEPRAVTPPVKEEAPAPVAASGEETGAAPAENPSTAQSPKRGFWTTESTVRRAVTEAVDKAVRAVLLDAAPSMPFQPASPPPADELQEIKEEPVPLGDLAPASSTATTSTVSAAVPESAAPTGENTALAPEGEGEVKEVESVQVAEDKEVVEQHVRKETVPPLEPATEERTPASARPQAPTVVKMAPVAASALSVARATAPAAGRTTLPPAPAAKLPPKKVVYAVPVPKGTPQKPAAPVVKKD